MKILHISHLYPCVYDKNLGIAIHKQVVALKEIGCEQKVISPTAWTPFPIKYLSRKWKSYSQVPAYENRDGIEVYYPKYISLPRAKLQSYSGYFSYWSMKRLIRIIYREFNFDLIHSHMTLPDGYAGMLVGRLYKKPLVLTFQATDLDITALRGRSHRLALGKVFNYARQIISPSLRLEKIFSSQYKLQAKFVGYGIDPELISMKTSELSSTYKDKRIILCVSRLMRSKGIDLNLLALSRLLNKYDNLLMIIIGDGPEKKQLERLARDMNLLEHVEFLGHIDHDRAMEYMAICELFSMPSWQETFGLVYIEAMANRKPIIAVKGQGVDGIVVHGETGFLVKPKDVDSIVEAMDYILKNPERLKNICRRAEKLAKECYNIQHIAKQTLGIYENALAKK